MNRQLIPRNSCLRLHHGRDLFDPLCLIPKPIWRKSLSLDPHALQVGLLINIHNTRMDNINVHFGLFRFFHGALRLKFVLILLVDFS